MAQLVRFEELSFSQDRLGLGQSENAHILNIFFSTTVFLWNITYFSIRGALLERASEGRLGNGQSENAHISKSFYPDTVFLLNITSFSISDYALIMLITY